MRCLHRYVARAIKDERTLIVVFWLLDRSAHVARQISQRIAEPFGSHLEIRASASRILSTARSVCDTNQIMRMKRAKITVRAKRGTRKGIVGSRKRFEVLTSSKPVM